VMPHSILTVVGSRDDHSNQFPIPLTEFASAVHGSLVQLKVCRKRIGGKTMDLEDVGYATGLATLFLIDSVKIASRFGLIDDLYPRHGSRPE
jgi:hypothetical protein